MPEGHSIHRLARVLTELFADAVVHASSPQGRFAAGAEILNGSRILPAQAWGKHLFIPFLPAGTESPAAGDTPAHPAPAHPHASLADPAASEALWLHVHLGLYGRWVFNGDSTFLSSPLLGVPHIIVGEESLGAWSQEAPTSLKPWHPHPPRGTVRLRIQSDHGTADLSGPNQCIIQSGTEVGVVVGRLGPDPLRNEPGDRERFISLVRARRSPVGALVMDQSVAAGPGNIYRAESLFRTGINPYRPGAKVSATRLGHLWDDLVHLMRDGLSAGTITTVSPDLVPSPLPANDAEATRFAVYHRQGRACLRCGATIREADMAGRRLFWCPGCQH
ncbi:Fpg/Nei family DNA glycosylase [Trueperella pecoris]|uniref:DNA-(apurinic or apyrimidinic site) lyase n=1 Tax=Trueperella pecoris TaxID=2733571 RepID=A0A7M1R2P1_9ACTO|nr:Fpg/Nei family DNA glycosylase [Trueperella pecoris]QOR47974.1 Fpg/Nei family DNA glycosylase [Trueperella pecoris]